MENSYNRKFTWADALCNERIGAKKSGQLIEVNECLNTCVKGEVILIEEFDLEARKRQPNPTQHNLKDVLTGKKWLVKCTHAPENTIVLTWGMPMVKRHGNARFKIMEVVV